MQSERRCSNCERPMQVLDLSGHYQRRVEIDTCAHCCLIWFDGTESVRLAAPGVVDLVRQIHGAMRPGGEHEHAVSLTRVQTCPVCGAQLKPVHNRTRFGRTTHLECPKQHGYYQTFILYLAEKGFVRPLAWSDIRDGRELFCAGCGYPLPAKPHEWCPACQSTVGVVDPARLAQAIDPNDFARLIAGDDAPAPAAASVEHYKCHACGGSLDASRHIHCPHCRAPVRRQDTGEAVAAAAAMDKALRANHERQHPAVTRAKLDAMPPPKMDFDIERQTYDDARDHHQVRVAWLIAFGLGVFLATRYFLGEA